MNNQSPVEVLDEILNKVAEFTGLAGQQEVEYKQSVMNILMMRMMTDLSEVVGKPEAEKLINEIKSADTEELRIKGVRELVEKFVCNKTGSDKFLSYLDELLGSLIKEAGNVWSEEQLRDVAVLMQKLG